MTSASTATQDPVAGVVRMLAAFLDVTQGEVSEAVGMPKRTFIRRMQSGGWTVMEVRQLAAYFGVSVSHLLDGPQAFFREGYQPTTERYLTDSHLPPSPVLAHAA